MTSVMSEFDIDRNPSFFAMESPKEEQILASADLQIPPSIFSPIETRDLEETRVRVSEASGTHGFVTGDMVWGKVKSHPWWPGHIFDESFASPSVRRTKRENFFLVAFFGDSSYGWFDPTELIPYEPTFLEKSNQTTLRSFLDAVEESLDEISRRAALGISCRCQDSDNFRPAKVLNYFEVDVVGYEKNAVYSKSQIQKERKDFHPKGVLSFLQNLAVMMRGSERKDVEWHRNVAAVLAWRGAKFKEFDVTYSLAFGQLPARDDQDETFTPRVVPLSGPLKIAETLDNKKKSSISKKKKISLLASSSSSSAYKEKVNSNKYVLKRREEQHNATTIKISNPPLLPDAYFPQKQPTLILNNSNSDPSAFDYDYVLRKREKVEDIKHDISVTECDADDGDAKKEKKIEKRPIEGGNELKIKKRRIEREASRARENSDVSHLDLGRLGQLAIPNVVSDLLELSLDPFYGIENDVPLIVRSVFLRFRSLVYSQSLVPSPPPPPPPSRTVLPSPNKANPTKLMQRSGVDPKNVTKKRGPSDRQEEILAKRIKKLHQLKSMTQKTSDGGPKVNKNETTRTTTELAKKPEEQEPVLPLPPKKESPTFLLMKFPSRSTLPSIWNLKARFTRFGPLELDSTRVFWETHSCRVQFKYKPDALKALNFVKSSDIFGQIQVECSIREVEPSKIESSLADVPSRPNAPKSIPKRPGGDTEVGKESQRAKFNLPDNIKISKDIDSLPSADVAPSPAPPSKFISFQLQPLLPPPAGSHEQPRPLPPPHPTMLNAVEKWASPVHLDVDISHEMLSLLLRCNNIVSELKALPGFALHRAL